MQLETGSDVPDDDLTMTEGPRPPRRDVDRELLQSGQGSGFRELQAVELQAVELQTVELIDLEHQTAQKIHAVTDPSDVRAHDPSRTAEQGFPCAAQKVSLS
ncbi:hypothetical protein ACTXO9_16315 [Brachybacterium tyrofermentans]|uniref:hypothetical protein n=1 Tax=Brachybacterium tyrofermentans TaxID=47848 RepID=UPI003FD41C25